MLFSKFRNVLLFTIIFAGSANFLYSEIFNNSDKTVSLPSFIIWAWERLEDLTFLEYKNAGVGVLVRRAVKSTRYTGCKSAETSEFSRQAFQILHKNYPTSSWAKSTPYWY